MGIKGINSFLRSKEVDCFFSLPLTEFSGHRIAIDGLNWIYSNNGGVIKNLLKYKKNILDDIDQEDINEGMLLAFIRFNVKLLDHKITPVWIWDGVSQVNKEVTKITRRQTMEKEYNKKIALQEKLSNTPLLACDQGELEQFRKLVSRCSRINYNGIEMIKKYLETTGIPTIVAKDEAENLASSLAVELKIAAVWSSDTDTYPLGAPIVVKGFEKGNNGNVNITGVFTLNILRDLKLNHEEFRYFCMLLGTDFNDNIAGIGPVGAYTLIKTYKDIEKIGEETNHNVYNFNDEIKSQLTPYKTDLTDKDLNIVNKNPQNPFKDRKNKGIFLQFANNIRDAKPGKRIEKYKTN